MQGDLSEHRLLVRAHPAPELGHLWVEQDRTQREPVRLGLVDAEDALRGAVHPGDPSTGIGRDHSDAHAVDGVADEAAARVLANVPQGWAHEQLAATATMPMPVIWLEGDAISLTGIDRGGNRV